MAEKQSSDPSPHQSTTASSTGEPPNSLQPILGEKKQSEEEKHSQLQSYWNSLSSEQRKEILTIRIEDLRHHLTMITSSGNEPSSSSSSLLKHFDEAIAYGKRNRERTNRWEFWLCSYCNDDLLSTDSEILRNHVAVHAPLPKITARLDAKWVQLVFNGTWKPVVVSEAIKLLQDLHNSDESDSEKKKKKLEWILCEDVGSDRAIILTKVGDMFKHLISRNSLADSNIAVLLSYANREVEKIIPKELQKSLAVTHMAQTHLPFCFLDVNLLRKILGCLQDLSNAGDSVEGLVDINGAFRHDLSMKQNIMIIEEVDFSNDDDDMCLVLSEDTVGGSCPFSVISIKISIDTWRYLRNGKKWVLYRYGDVCQRAHQVLDAGSTEREKLTKEEEVLGRIRKIYSVEHRMREDVPGHDLKSYVSVLQQRQSQILNSVADDMAVLEFQTIEKILIESWGPFLDPGFEFELPPVVQKPWIIQESAALFIKQDAAVVARVRENWKRVALKQNQIEASMVKLDHVMKSFALGCEEACALDFRVLLVPLIKSFIRANMERQMERHAEGSSTCRDLASDNPGTERNTTDE